MRSKTTAQKNAIQSERSKSTQITMNGFKKFVQISEIRGNNGFEIHCSLVAQRLGQHPPFFKHRDGRRAGNLC
jgi:hypothetical protein